MTKKPLEELLEELKQDLEDAIAVLNALKREIPKEIKEDIRDLKESQIQQLKTIDDYLVKAFKTLETIEKKMLELEKKLYITNEKLYNIYEQNLQNINQTLNDIYWHVGLILKDIEKTAQKGVLKAIKSSTDDIKKQLKLLYVTAEEINRNTEENRKQLAFLLEHYKWKLLSPLVFSNVLLLLMVIYIILQSAEKQKIANTLVGLTGLIVPITGAYISYEFWKNLKRPIVGYLISLIFILVTLFIGYTLFKGEFILTQKAVCNISTLNKAENQTK